MDGRQADDAAAGALVDHVAGGALRREEVALQGQVHHPIPELLVNLEQGEALIRNDGVVDEDVDTAMGFDEGVDDGVDAVDGTHVATVHGPPTPVRLDKVSRVLRNLVVDQVVDAHAGALAREREDDAATDALASAGDQGTCSLPPRQPMS